MNRVDRLMAMALRLQSRRLVRAEDLATDFEISIRTVYRDIAALGEAGIPVLSEPGVGYSLAKGYHLPPVMFTAEEASALSIGAKLVEHWTDASLRKQMDSALLKIRSVLPRDRQDYLDRLERSTAIYVPCQNNIPRLSSETLTPIQRALAERRVLSLQYQGRQRSEVTRRDVEPLGLVYYGENWHLIAYCRLRRDVRDFRTDRVLKLDLRDQLFSGHADFSLKKYLEGQMNTGDFEIAQIRFHQKAMDRVRRERYWGILDEKPEGEMVAVTLLDRSLQWIVEWILSFGSLAEVLEPRHLREEVAADAQKLALAYSAPSPALFLGPRPNEIPSADQHPSPIGGHNGAVSPARTFPSRV